MLHTHASRRNRPKGGAYLCIEVKPSLADGRDQVMKNQLFPYLKLSGAEHGLLAGARLSSEGHPKLETMLVSAGCTPPCDCFEPCPFARNPSPYPAPTWLLGSFLRRVAQ
jgi:hypothetical protein